MPPRAASSTIPLPRGWTKIVRSAALHAISLASAALTTAWAKAAVSRSSRRRLAAEVDRLRAELALVAEELEIKHARWSRLPARRRPYYGPIERLRVLELRAARGWTAGQTAQRFLVTEDTIASWIRRVDEGGERALVRTPEPVNRFPEYVAHLVRTLKRMSPALGKVRIAQALARAGLHLGATTVGRMLNRGPREAGAAAEDLGVAAGRGVIANYPNHVWHVDLSVIPTSAGFWVPWLPFAKPQRWPFGWWIAVVLDQASRRLVGFAVFKTRPSSHEVCAFLNRAIERIGSAPKYVISDKGKEFDSRAFKEWCSGRGIRPRYGAVGQHGSIAIIERFIRSMKDECTRRVLVPLRLDAVRHELACHATWYNEHRPHQGLGGRTPMEVYEGQSPANEAPRFEPRPRWPRGSRCAQPVVPVAGQCGAGVELVLGHVERRRHLPVVQLKLVA